MAKQRFIKKLVTGLHSAIIDGKRQTIKPGEYVTCTPEELGSALSNYELAPAPGKSLSPQKDAFRRWFDHLKFKSGWLNPDHKPGIGQIFYSPSDISGLSAVQDMLEDESFNAAGQATGAMSAAKLRLKSAHGAWAHQCKCDPNGMKSLKNPEGEYLEAIAQAEAQLAVLKAEIVEVKKRIAAAIESEKNQTDDRAERMRFKGQGRLREGRFVEMDGRAVVYRDGLPCFVDDGMSLSDYKILIKQHRAEKSKQRAIKAKEFKRQAEATA